MTKLTDYRKRISNKAIRLLKEVKLVDLQEPSNKKFIQQLRLQLKLSRRLWISPKQLKWLESLALNGEREEIYDEIDVYDFCD